MLVISALTAGNYALTLTDDNGCSDTVSIQLSAPDSLPQLFVLTNDESCAGNCDGSATLNIALDTSVYSITWSNAATGFTASGLCSGPYQIMVTDSNGCSISDSITIAAPTPLSASAIGNANGSATASANGGNTPYSFLWDAAANNQTTATASGLGNATYMVTITDFNGCTDTATVTIVGVSLEAFSVIDQLKLYPNPTNASVFVDIKLAQKRGVKILVMNAMGQLIMSRNPGIIESKIIELPVEHFAGGVYMIQVVVDGQVYSRKLLVGRK